MSRKTKRMDKKTKSHWSGQFFAAGELVRRGYWSSFTVGNVPSTDIVAISQKGTPFKVEVKTTRSWGKNWPAKLVSPSDDLFYIFVIARPKEGFPAPEFWVMTSYEIHRLLKRQKRGGRSLHINRTDLPKEPGGWDKLPDYSSSAEE